MYKKIQLFVSTSEQIRFKKDIRNDAAHALSLASFLVDGNAFFPFPESGLATKTISSYSRKRWKYEH